MAAIEISVTEASRNFSDCINRVRYRGVSFVLMKNGVAVARIVPEPAQQVSGENLAEALRDAVLAEQGEF
jgi:prevent-host-death family protein